MQNKQQGQIDTSQDLHKGDGQGTKIVLSTFRDAIASAIMADESPIDVRVADNEGQDCLRVELANGQRFLVCCQAQ